jgi:hypothetical protein
LTLPLGVNGSAASTTMAAGTMNSGSTARKPSVSRPAKASAATAGSDGTTYATISFW